MHARDMRQIHAARVFYAMLTAPDLSQKEICDRTGYDKSTVSLILKRFEDLRIVTRSKGVATGQRGRPVDLLRISEESGLLVGVHLEFDGLKFVATSIGGHLLTILDAELPQPNRLGTAMQAGIRKLCAAIGRSPKEVTAVGVTVPGQIGSNDVLVYSPNLAWRDVDLGHQVRRHVDVPVFFDNDVKALALAEHLFGLARGLDDFVMLSGGRGVGGALFLDGDVYRGRGGFAGEIGHTKVVAGGRPCHCGASGCLAAYLSLPALFERVSALGAKVSTFETLEARAAAGDLPVATVCHESGYLLGLAVANLINTINPPAVLVAGTLARLWPYLKQGFEEALGFATLSAPLSQTSIMVAAPAPDTFPKGGIAIALHATTGMAQIDGLPW